MEAVPKNSGEALGYGGTERQLGHVGVDEVQTKGHNVSAALDRLGLQERRRRGRCDTKHLGDICPELFRAPTERLGLAVLLSVQKLEEKASECLDQLLDVRHRSVKQPQRNYSVC